ncbi:hypothetical protein ABFS82_06G173000 [Erythranthe guttata]|uniref:F-box domain-containing protein n=1 Tax=Erythranthe guttata TaxID=4155 RepID=A0A022RHV4_ERYGU|nr:PREDICTED: F-box/kelch-repeat protein At3g23880-like [Erythranthe guttata]EYU39786.1 hypothetical protein MIMGU_mgv1a008178mg [Erythranthe guttata]|eukprot:XP_012834535.1 PREDICTED: F-box/kelch-repeat protein At3g23880-like [Erythranthe guttata]
MVTKSESKLSQYDHRPSPTRTRLRIPPAAAAAADETLPAEIIEEILLRLPVRSLLKFTSVSKSWRALISSNDFIKAHLEISRKDTNFTRYGVVSAYLPLSHCSLPSLFSGLVTDAVSVDFPFPISVATVCVRGTCNGLVCIVISMKHIFLWNPSTRKFKQLPDATDDRLTMFVINYGFGYDESNDDYKVLVVFNGGRDGAIVKIYSCTTNSWKRIEAFEDGLPFNETGRFVSGNLHWSRRRVNESDSKWDIVSFDLASEICGNVAQPIYVDGDFAPWFRPFGDCLCVFYDHPGIGVDVWVMKEYGVSESWAKIVTVPYLHDPGQGRFSKPFCIGPKGEILVECLRSFMIYSPKDKRSRLAEIRSASPFLEADVYCESLVSLV